MARNVYDGAELDCRGDRGNQRLGHIRRVAVRVCGKRAGIGPGLKESEVGEDRGSENLPLGVVIN